MGGGVFVVQGLIACGGNHCALPQNYRADRHFAARCCGFGFVKCAIKCGRLVGFFQNCSRCIKRLQFQQLLVYQKCMTDKSTYDPTRAKPLSLKKPRPDAAPAGARIAKVMARAGLCSRRDAEAWINAGRVRVNDVILTSPALNVTPKDIILVDNQPLTAPEPTRLFMFHKPRGTVTTDRDPEGRTTIFEVLPEWLPRTVTIGRLDINTEGLLLLTNDGGLARVLELPKTGWLRRYRVRAHGEIDQATLDNLRNGITIDGVNYAGIEATLDRIQGSNMWLTMGLREGKNREIKRVLEHLGLSVNRLIRLSFGPFQLQDLEEGAVEEIKTRIIEDQLGEALIAEAGCVFSEPVERTAKRAEMFEGASRKMKPEQDFSGPAREPDEQPRRKHIKTLRNQRDTQMEKGPRVRTVSSSTQDSRGRAVTVDRLERPRPVRDERSDRPARGGERPMRGDYAARPERGERPARGEHADRGERSAKPYTPRAGHGERPDFTTRADRDARGARPEGRPARSEGRPQRSEGGKSFGDKPSFGDKRRFDKPAGGERTFKPREKRAEGGYEERPRTGRDFDKRQLSARSFKEREDSRGAKPAGAKPAFKGARSEKPAYGDKPAYAGRDSKPSFKPRSDKPNRPTRGPAGSGGKPSGGSRPPRGR